MVARVASRRSGAAVCLDDSEGTVPRRRRAASSFIDLANSGFYNGLHFHRVIVRQRDADAARAPPPRAIVTCSLSSPSARSNREEKEKEKPE